MLYHLLIINLILLPAILIYFGVSITRRLEFMSQVMYDELQALTREE